MSDKKQIDEISSSCLTNYVIKAGSDRQLHSAKAGVTMTRSNSPRGEAEVKSRMAKTGQKHALKAFNRAVGIDRAMKKLTKEETQLDEISAQTLSDYEDASTKSSHAAKNKGDKNTLRKRIAGAKMLNKKADTCGECGGSGVEHGHSSSDGHPPCKECDGRGHVFEETQQIDEISKPTLRSYVHKAMDDIDKRSDSAVKEFKATGKATKYINRQRGVVKAIDKLVKEENLDEADLSSKSRDKLSKKKFGLPGKRKYPMPDKKHAANAKARATQMVEKGKLSSSEAAKIRAKANKILGEDVEQIDELSRDTLNRYIPKARASKKHHEHMADAHDDIALAFRHSVPSHEKKHRELEATHDKVAKKRERGLDRAANSLSKIHPKKDGVRDKQMHEGYLSKFKTLVEDRVKRKGRPRKPRHEDGEIVNDPHAINIKKDKE